MKAFVTGSTGLLGSNLVQELLKQGYSVKALVRSKEKAQQLLGKLDVELIVGDMENVAGFAPRLAGSDVLFHTAAYFREYYGTGDNHWQMLEKINITGTIQLLNAAEKYGIKKVIYTSSSGVLGREQDGRLSDENTQPDAAAMQNLYFRSKVIAEEKIFEWLKTHTLPVVQILPTAMFGPWDNAPTGAGQFVLNFLHGNVPVIPPGGFSVIDVRDVAAAMVSAVEKGRSGERYIINNRYYSAREILTILSRLTGVPVPRFSPPYIGALTFAYISEFMSRFTGKAPVAPVNAIKTLALKREATAEKAKRELGLTIRPFEETLRDEVQWYLDHGYIKTAKPFSLIQQPAK